MKKLWSSPATSFLRQSILLYLDCRGPQAAACLAYFMLLTFFPILICVSACLGLLDIDIGGLAAQLEGILPFSALQLIRGYLSYISGQQSLGFFVAGLAACWFSGAAAFRTITRVILDVYQEATQSLLRGVLYSFLFPFALMVVIDLSVIVVVTGQRTLLAISSHFPFLEDTLHIWSYTRFVLLFAVFFLFVLAVFYLAAPRGVPRAPVMLGSFISSLAMVVSSGAFSWMVSLSTRYSLVYGSLVSLIMLLLWLYLCGQVLFLTIVFTGVWYQNRQRLHKVE